MDLTESIIPRSDQINADDLIAGPITYTVREVIKGAAEQPFDFLLVETDRAYRPSKTMRRVIVNAWGADAANYAGRRLTLYREPSIKYGGQEVGGIRISHMSHIAGPVEVMAQTTRGKREKFTVQPLKTASVAPAAGTAEHPEAGHLDDQTAAPANEPAGDAHSPVVGGLVIDSLEHAQRLIHALNGEQLGILKRMLGIEGQTNRRILADQLITQRKGEDAQDILAQMAGWS